MCLPVLILLFHAPSTKFAICLGRLLSQFRYDAAANKATMSPVTLHCFLHLNRFPQSHNLITVSK